MAFSTNYQTIQMAFDQLLNEFRTAISAERVLTGEDVSERFVHVWRMEERLTSRAILLPESTSEVSAILSICSRFKQPVVLHGGLTGLTGATDNVENEIVISLERMNAIEEIDEDARTITVGAGVILETVQSAAKNCGLLFPLNFGAKGSAQIGGIVATNAGGLRVVRYGMTRALVLGLEVVLADGTVISSMKKIIKDNSAYDLKQLFIGSEGTLGVITKAILRLYEAPKSRCSALVGLSDYEEVVSFLKYMDGGLAGGLSAYELIWRDTYIDMTSPPSLMKPPLPYDHNYYVLLESLGGDQERDEEYFEKLLLTAIEEGRIKDGVLATNQADLNWFWTIREDVGVLNHQYSYMQHFDISMPIPLIGSTVNEIVSTLNQIPSVLKVYAFGHVADGNIHVIVAKADHTPELTEAINDIVYGPLKAMRGSVSAEHGIGIYKKEYLKISRTPEEVLLMKHLKKSLDPFVILNRGRVLDI